MVVVVPLTTIFRVYQVLIVIVRLVAAVPSTFIPCKIRRLPVFGVAPARRATQYTLSTLPFVTW